MIHFNDEQASKMRGKEERLSLEEETQAIQLMNEALECLSGRRIVKERLNFYNGLFQIMKT